MTTFPAWVREQAESLADSIPLAPDLQDSAERRELRILQQQQECGSWIPVTSRKVEVKK